MASGEQSTTRQEVSHMLGFLAGDAYLYHMQKAREAEWMPSTGSDEEVNAAQSKIQGELLPALWDVFAKSCEGGGNTIDEHANRFTRLSRAVMCAHVGYVLVIERGGMPYRDAVNFTNAELSYESETLSKSVDPATFTTQFSELHDDFFPGINPTNQYVRKMFMKVVQNACQFSVYSGFGIIPR